MLILISIKLYPRTNATMPGHTQYRQQRQQAIYHSAERKYRTAGAALFKTFPPVVVQSSTVAAEDAKVMLMLSYFTCCDGYRNSISLSPSLFRVCALFLSPLFSPCPSQLRVRLRQWDHLVIEHRARDSPTP